MADPHRSERQLMRQRGAGLRNGQNIDFDLKLNTQGSREDRQLMRQRGAGHRKMSNIDFGFSIPTPSQSRRSSRTPQTARQSIERRSKTPTSALRRQRSTVPPPMSEFDKEDRISTQHRLSKTPQPVTQAEQPNSSKRRRLNNSSGGNRAAEIYVNVPPTRENASEARSFTVAEDYNATSEVPEPAQSGSAGLGSVDTLLHAPGSPLSLPANVDKENDDAKLDGSKPRVQRRSNSAVFRSLAGNNATERHPVRSESIVESIEEIGSEDAVHEGAEANIPSTSTPKTYADDEQNARRSSTAMTTNEIGEVHSTGTNTSRKRRKRKLVVLGRKKRRSSGGIGNRSSIAGDDAYDHSQADDIEEREDALTAGESTLGHLSEENRLEPSDRNLPLWKKIILKKAQGRRNRLSVSTSPARHEREDEEGDGTYVDDDGSPEPITPAPRKKKEANRGRTRRSTSSTGDRRKTKSGGLSFPITTYRMTNTHTLPTIVEEDNENGPSEDATETLPPTFSSRAQPNAIDVFTQICRETIQTTIEKLGGGSTTTTTGRAEIKAKRTALEAFSESLEQRLFDMSEAVEHRMTLEARLRKSKREKAALQAQWIGVRQQRDELALKADNIRRQNWNHEEESKLRWEVSELAHKTELELNGVHSDNEDLEFKLRKVGGSISSFGGQGGILNRVKSFNSQLERLASVLERR